jgi:hypothetical protein
MQIKLQPFIAATLALALLAACGERAKDETAAAPAAGEQTAQTTQTATAQGTTTTFAESAAEPQQPPAQ